MLSYLETGATVSSDNVGAQSVAICSMILLTFVNCELAGVIITMKMGLECYTQIVPTDRSFYAGANSTWPRRQAWHVPRVLADDN